MGYSRQAILRRERCYMKAETRIIKRNEVAVAKERHTKHRDYNESTRNSR
jgi:hypothetical protein